MNDSLIKPYQTSKREEGKEKENSCKTTGKMNNVHPNENRLNKKELPYKIWLFRIVFSIEKRIRVKGNSGSKENWWKSTKSDESW